MTSLNKKSLGFYSLSFNIDDPSFYRASQAKLRSDRKLLQPFLEFHTLKADLVETSMTLVAKQQQHLASKMNRTKTWAV